MNTLNSLQEIARAIRNLIRTGIVTDVDHDEGLCRIQTGGMETTWLNWLTCRAGRSRVWWAPSVGEQVLLLAIGGELDTAFALPGIFSDDHPAPSASPDALHVSFPDGAVIEYEPENGALTVSGIKTADVTGYHLYSQRSKDGSLQFQYNGAGLFSGYLRAGGEVQSSSANSYRIAYGAFGTFWRNDGGSLYLMLTNKDDPWGNYNALRPFRVSLNNGEVIISKLNLSDFGYFDARYYTKAQSDAGYMPKTGAYTKAESDGRFQPKGNYTPAGQAYTKAESDARYGVVNGIRRGGQQIRNPTDAWFGNWESPAGCVVTGIQMDGRSDGRKLGVYFRQMQYLNKQTGAWVNIGD